MFEKIDDSKPIDAEENNFNVNERYFEPPPPPPVYLPPPPPPLPSLDDNKNVYIALFIAFIIGFFMGKTLQPIIIKSG